MDLKDNKGRWMQVTSPEIRRGHSVCNSCWKDMPRCWDVICKICRGTFCYGCAIEYGDYWYCKDCYMLMQSALYRDSDIMKMKKWKSVEELGEDYPHLRFGWDGYMSICFENKSGNNVMPIINPNQLPHILNGL